MRMLCLALALASALAACAAAPASAQSPTPSSSGPPQPEAFDVEGGASEADKAAAVMVEAGRARIEAYFAAPFPRAPRVVLARSRAEFDAAIPAAWEMTPTRCWMVGVGVADFLAVLAPAAWGAEACEHNANDPAEAQAIITHELVHTYHGQFNPTGDFTGMDELGWFVEGLAVVVSGQFETRRGAAAEAIAAGAAPSLLEDAWGGRYRYGVCASMVRYIDETYGRGAIVDLLRATTNEDALARLGVSEAAFLAGWRAWALAQNG